MITRRSAAASHASPMGPRRESLPEDGGDQVQRLERPSAFIIQVTAVASLGGILFGYDLGVISGALPQLAQAFDLSSRQQEFVVSILYLGGALGAALGGSMCDMFGRKRSIIITDLVFLVGGLLLYASPSYLFLLIGRTVVGFAVAVSGIADVAYLHEIAPTKWRGAIVSVNEACISLGFLLAFGVAGMLSYEESPSWLQERGRFQEAEDAWRRINSERSFTELVWVEDETRELSSSERGVGSSYRSIGRDSSVAIHTTDDDEKLAVPRQVSPSIRPTAPGLVGILPQYFSQVCTLLKQFLLFAQTTMTDYRKQAYIALFLSVTQQFCGQTNVLSYAPLIFASAAKSEDAGVFVGGATLLIGLVKFLVTVLVIWRIEQIGRRILLLVGMGTIAIGLFLLLVAFRGLDVEDAQDGEIENQSNGFVLALPGVLLVVSGYSMSFGPLTWLLTSELFPTDIRGRALGASTIVTYAAAAVVTSTFLTAQEAFGASMVFGGYLLVTCLGVVFAFSAISETKGRTEAEIDDDLSIMLWWRQTRAAVPGEGDTEMTRTESADYIVV